MRTVKTFLVALLLGSASVASATIISDNSISGTVTNTFTGLGSGNVLGTISQTGATYSERFAGQTLGTSGGFDTLSGTPTGPLSLVSNPVLADNVGIIMNNGSNVIYGDLGGAIGEGALSILLSSDTDVFGFNVVGTNLGAFNAIFFGRNGSLLGSITHSNIGDGFFGFRATAGERIAGVSLVNTDPAGIGYDNFVFNQLPIRVPEPASLALFGLALFGVAARRRK